MGAEHRALWSTDKEGGHEKAYCCFNSNARDFARIGQLMLDSGRWKGVAIISRHITADPLSMHDSDEDGKPAIITDCNGGGTLRAGYSMPWYFGPVYYCNAGKTYGHCEVGQTP